ncbi:uncharacterized protein LOC141630359 [Silene latifolia]|uniref:uncharacterized protein LOC141630359 n=1 Tax=Silene latifolia TaxID=37657 RepID=UPI003D789052
MFIRADFIAPDLDYLNYLVVEGVNDWVNNPNAEGSADRIAAFMALPEEERTWPACLGQAPMPHFKKAKLSTYKPVKSAKALGASSSGTTRASARIASFGLSLVKAGVSQITREKSKSSEATGSDSVVQIQEPMQEVQLASPEKVVDEGGRPQKRKREDESSGGVHEVKGSGLGWMRFSLLRNISMLKHLWLMILITCIRQRILLPVPWLPCIVSGIMLST